MKHALLFVAMTALLAACGADPAPSEPQAVGRGVEVADAFVNQPLGGRDVSLGGLTIIASGADAKIIAASTPAAERVELHTHALDDGVMRMRQVEFFDLMDGEAMTLGRGGPHLMLFGVDDALNAGDEVELALELQWDNGDLSTVTVAAAIHNLDQ
ncbi:MAG: copper chaperone PCu(A)C [Pseudomonadota bacterium]